MDVHKWFFSKYKYFVGNMQNYLEKMLSISYLDDETIQAILQFFQWSVLFVSWQVTNWCERKWKVTLKRPGV